MSATALAAAIAAIDPNREGLRTTVALHTVDALACLESGRRTGEGALISRFYSKGASVDSAIGAAGASAVIRFTECDAIHVPSCVSPAAITIPVALAFATDLKGYVAGVEAGFAVGIALGEAIGGVSALTQGVWPTLFAAPAIAAATASRALGHGPEVIAQALVLSLAGTSGRLGRPAGLPSGRWLAIGEATLKGIRAVLAAENGFNGDIALLSASWLEAQAGPKLARPDRLETLVEGASAAVGLKPFVAARQGSNAIQAFREMLADGIAPESIDRIKVYLPPAAVAVVSRALDSGDRLSSIAHLGLQLGHAAFAPHVLLDIGREGPVDPGASRLAGQTEVVADAALDASEPGTWPARVAVRSHGSWIEKSCSRLQGDAGDKNLDKLVASKIERLCAPQMAVRLHGIMTGMAEGGPISLAEAARAMNDPAMRLPNTGHHLRRKQERNAREIRI